LAETKGRAQDRATLQQNLQRVLKAVVSDKEGQLTTLWHHVYNVDHLRATFHRLRKKAAPGVDGVTWEEYAADLEGNLQDLSERLRRGAYRAKPVRRTYIPKPDGRKRPLGIPTLEDKLVLRHIKKWLNAGVLEDGKRTQAESGTPQGGSVSPLLANIYLH
jgi:RNA-directed DNA polymerase